MSRDVEHDERLGNIIIQLLDMWAGRLTYDDDGEWLENVDGMMGELSQEFGHGNYRPDEQSILVDPDLRRPDTYCVAVEVDGIEATHPESAAIKLIQMLRNKDNNRVKCWVWDSDNYSVEIDLYCSEIYSAYVVEEKET